VVYFRLFLSVFVVSMIAFYVIYVYLLKKRLGNFMFESLVNKRSGIFCYVCSEPVVTDMRLIVEKMSQNKEDLCLCQSCQRDLKLSQLLPSYKYTLKFTDRFKKWVLSKQSERIMWIFVVFPTTFVIISTIFVPSFSNFASYFNSFSLITYWSIMIYRIKLCLK
jgi:hypothetical protein